MRLLTDVGVPAKPLSPFSMAKGLSFAKGISLFVPCITRNLGHSVRVDSSVSKEASTTRARFLCEFLWGGVLVIHIVLYLFQHKCSPPALESNKGMHRGVITNTCASGIQLCYTPRRQYYKGESSGGVSSTRLPKVTPPPRLTHQPLPSGRWLNDQ